MLNNKKLPQVNFSHDLFSGNSQWSGFSCQRVVRCQSHTSHQVLFCKFLQHNRGKCSPICIKMHSSGVSAGISNKIEWPCETIMWCETLSESSLPGMIHKIKKGPYPTLLNPCHDQVTVSAWQCYIVTPLVTVYLRSISPQHQTYVKSMSPVTYIPSVSGQKDMMTSRS